MCNMMRLCSLLSAIALHGKHFKILLSCTFDQVEVKIDNSRDTSKDSVLANYVIEAALFDTARWYSSDRCADLQLSKMDSIKLNLSSSTSQGFHGYLLVGRLDMPWLWSAEKVRNYFFLFLPSLFLS